jgi:hypothetical protein
MGFPFEIQDTTKPSASQLPTQQQRHSERGCGLYLQPA